MPSRGSADLPATVMGKGSVIDPVKEWLAWRKPAEVTFCEATFAVLMHDGSLHSPIPSPQRRGA